MTRFPPLIDNTPVLPAIAAKQQLRLGCNDVERRAGAWVQKKAAGAKTV